jgi:hypothetical protein
MIKFLDIQHFDLCIELHKNATKVSGTIPIDLDYFKKNYLPYFQQQDNFCALGFFDSNTLVSWMSIRFHENKTRGKFWTIPCLYTSKFVNFFSINAPEVGLLVKNAMQFAESKKFYNYYYAVSEKVSRVYEHQWKKNIYVPTGRYETIIVDTVPANTIPKFELYWKLMGETVKPTAMIIKNRKLKEEFYEKKLI